MIKRLALTMVMATLVLTGGIVLGVLTESNGEILPNVEKTGQVRAMQCVVVAESGDVLTLEDDTHNLWLIADNEYCEDDVLCVWLDDMRTPQDLTDDVVLDYCACVVD